VKRADVKPGLYAYQEGKRGKLHPVLILDTSTFYANDAKSTGYYSKTKPGQPVFSRHDGWNGKGKWTATDGLGGMGSGTSPSTGFLASVPGRIGHGRSAYTRDVAVVSRGTLADALSLTLVRRERTERAISSGQPDRIRVTAAYPERRDDQPYYDTIDPRRLVGPWEDVTTAADEEQERRDAVDAERRAESAGRVAEARARWDRLIGLGLPAPHPDVAEPERRRYGMDDWEPVAFDQSLTAAYRLTAAQVDALLALIPEGATIPDPDTETEDDGWTLAVPPYERTRT
jgi:hypothetical protein